MSAPRIIEAGPGSLCSHCGQPADSRYFDASGITELPSPGREVTLARFELPPQYCGRLEYFSQFTDAHARDASRIDTPGIEWRILLNRHPLHPFLGLERIVNPWGWGSFPLSIRLDEGATLEFVVRHVGTASSQGKSRGKSAPPPVERVGARLVGRYWYNRSYGHDDARP